MERRNTALVLSKQINTAANLYPELSFIKSNFVIGHGTAGKVNYSNETEMNFKKQEKVLQQFRDHEFNLLIATSVVEEGLDIPKCNLVCRFDFPVTFRSYVQSKGRARAKNSNYYVFVDEMEYVEKQGELEVGDQRFFFFFLECIKVNILMIRCITVRTMWKICCVSNYVLFISFWGGGGGGGAYLFSFFRSGG